MPSVFISYRHEDAAHCANVLALARQLQAAGIAVVHDGLAQEQIFFGAGPNEGWPQWSKTQARNPNHKILIVASMGWFRCFLGEEKSGIGLGSAAEAKIIDARLTNAYGRAEFFRIVKVCPFKHEDIPVELGVFHAFRSPDDFCDILRWLNAGPPRQAQPRQQAPVQPQQPGQPPPQPHYQHEQPIPNQPAPQPQAQAGFFNWRPVAGGPYRRGFTAEEIERVLGQMTDPSIDVDSVRAVLEAEKARQVDVPEFQIARELVTNAQFRQFADATNYRTTAERDGEPESWRNYATPEKTNHPVVQVSFEDAQAFCQWAGVRLPTLDEWMKAYRGPNGNIYPWGNQFDASKCNTEENKTVMNTSPVNMFAAYPSQYGCYDMIGNVSEWVNAAGDTGPQVRNINPAVLEHLKRTRAIMGGAWSVSCQAFGLPVVAMLAPIEKSSNDLGFRVVH